MKILVTLIMLLFINNLAFGQNNQADTTKKKEQKNTAVGQQVHITPGSSGVKRSIGYKYSSVNADGDPGNGMFRLDNRNAEDARYIIIDDKDISGNDQTKWYSTWDDPTGATARGRATLADISGKIVCVFNFTGVFTDADGFWKLPVEYVSGSSLLDGVVYYYVFDRIANRNDPYITNRPRAKEQVEKTNVEAAVVTGAGIVAVTEVSQTTQVVQVNQISEVKEIKEEKQEQQHVAEVTEEKEVKEEKQEQVAQVTEQKEVKEEKQQEQQQVSQVTEQKEVKEEKQEQQHVAEVTEQKEVKEEKQEQQHVALVTEQKEVKEEKQVSQAVVTAAAATEVAVVVPTNNQVQAAVAEPPVQVKDTVNVKQTTQVNQAAATTTAVVSAGAIAATQTSNPPRVAQVNTSVTTQTTQSKPVTQTNPPTQTKPVTQTTPPAQTKPVTQTTPPTQTKPVAQTTTATQTKPATQATTTTVAVQPVQKTQTSQTTQTTQTVQKTQTSQTTQTTQPNQQTQSNQVVQPNNQPPAKQYNQFPVVQNIFASPGAGYGHRKWYRGIIEVGYGFGLGDYGINNFRFNFINAIRIGDFSSIGLGIGYRRYFTKNDAAPYLVSNENQIPLFLDLRTSFSTRKLTPYMALGIGASSGYRSAGTDKGLFMFNASGGIWYNVSSRFAVFAGIAYEMQNLQYSDTDFLTNSYIKSAGSISLNIGIAF
jgi:hypothetical protein